MEISWFTIDKPWTKDCELIENQDKITGVNFIITTTKPYVPVVTLSINDDIKFLEKIKRRSKDKRTISWNKYRSEITSQPKSNHLIIWFIQHLEMFIDCLYFHSEMATAILQDTFLIYILIH